MKVVKNKMAPPFRESEFDIMYNEGISQEGDLLDLAAKLNIVQKSGTWYSFGEERLGQGRENVKNFLKENAEFAQKIEALVKKQLGMTAETAEVSKAEDKPAVEAVDSKSTKDKK